MTEKDKKYKFLVISDIHFGKKDDKELYNMLNKYFIKNINESIDFVIISGDLFDRILKMNEPASVFSISFINILTDLSKIYDFKIRILKGTKTHDGNQLSIFKFYENQEDIDFKIIETVHSEMLFDDLSVLYIPEEYVEEPDEYYKDYFDKKYDLIFFHGNMDFAAYSSHIQSERNVKNAPNFNSKQISELAYGPIIGGHVHIRDNYKNKIFYCGSFDRTSFGEEEPKGYIESFYEPNTKNYTVEYINNDDAELYVTVDFSNIEGTLEEKIKTIDELKEEFKNIRINFTNTESKGNETIIETLKSISSSKIKIEINKDLDKKEDFKYNFILNKEFDLNTTIQKYIKLEYDKDIKKENIIEAISQIE